MEKPIQGQSVILKTSSELLQLFDKDKFFMNRSKWASDRLGGAIGRVYSIEPGKDCFYFKISDSDPEIFFIPLKSIQFQPVVDYKELAFLAYSALMSMVRQIPNNETLADYNFSLAEIAEEKCLKIFGKIPVT